MGCDRNWRDSSNKRRARKAPEILMEPQIPPPPPPPSPPVWARVLLRIGLSGYTREVISADLQEEYQLVVASRGAAAGRRWYWRQVIGSLAACWRRRTPRVASASSAWRRERRMGRKRSRVRVLLDALAMHALAQDVRYAWRTLRTRTAFSASVVLHWETTRVAFAIEEP